MRSMLIAFVAAAGLVAVAAPATAGPDCFCDPNPVTNLLHCLINGDHCPTLPSVPPAPQPAIPPGFDPREWPCTCDPMPQPFDVGGLLA